MSQNLATTRAIFDAFARGDVLFILERLAADVQWEYGVSATDVPWYQNRSGRDGALEFFQSLAAIEFKTFQVKHLLENAEGTVVAALLDSDYVVRATGKLVSYIDAVMLFRFNAAGEVSHFAHRVDLSQAVQAVHSV